MNKSYGGPSDDFDYVAVDGLPFVVDLKGDTTKIVDRYTIPRYVENLKTLHKYYEARIHSKRRSNERHWL